ncbi:MAG TPA: hypothetical protein DCX54_05970 [Flavobacteriales bacterium]|nr:hypothetical protein [Flavobacteriales bacterium]
MNMRTLINILLLVVLSFSFESCKREEEKGDPQYLVNPVTSLPPNAGKLKLKTNQQYVAILHANLFQVALSANQIFEISQCIESVGDKEIAREVIISNFMNEPGVIMPSAAEMRADIRTFIIDTYQRFLVRNPTEAEIEYFKNYISANPNVTPELVYFSFSLANEYLYY